jgi:hypothetical protein
VFRSRAGQRSNRKDDVIMGLAKFDRSLRNLDTTMIRKTLGVATRKACAPILKAMRAEVKPISETMARSFGTKIKIYKNSKNVIGLVGVRNSKSVAAEYSDPRQRSRGKFDHKGMHDPRFTFHLVDLGTKPHRAKSFGKAYFMHPGTHAQGIRQKALDSSTPQSSAIYEAALKKAVDEVIG